jgi:hypothetical protein
MAKELGFEGIINNSMQLSPTVISSSKRYNGAQP